MLRGVSLAEARSLRQRFVRDALRGDVMTIAVRAKNAMLRMFLCSQPVITHSSQPSRLLSFEVLVRRRGANLSRKIWQRIRAEQTETADKGPQTWWSGVPQSALVCSSLLQSDAG